MFLRIVVALDGSTMEEQAPALAIELGRRIGAPLHLVRVADPTRFRFGANETALEYAALGRELEAEEAESRESLAGIEARLGADGTPATTEVRRGLASQAVAEATLPADLLVLASHGRTGPARWLLGSMVEDAVRHAKVPVLLIRASPSSSHG